MKNEEWKDHGFGERSLGFLLLFVCDKYIVYE